MTGPERRRVVLTTDCGTEMDDQWALAHLFLSPSIELRAVVTTHAPNLPSPAAEASAAEAKAVLEHLPGGTGVDVIPGSSTPLQDVSSPIVNAGVERIVEEARACSDGRLALLAIGAATDVASALIVAPDVVDCIEVVAMGFQGRDLGGDEWNVKNDPNAWRAILGSSVPLTVGDASVCKEWLCLTPAKASALLDGRGDIGQYLAGILTTWLDANGEVARLVTGQDDTWPVWDEIVVAHLLGMTQWVSSGRPVLRPDLSFDRSESAGEMRWITHIDVDALWSDLAHRCVGR